ncbi:MAG TPA: isovaleryl-CoA dehydrogenase [Actinomycetota bacterium]|jgi:putative acyl-CoA dehydrogenase|nr:isovaleryl-CoA dehydrogenase [Actinomycetota bacterium]
MDPRFETHRVENQAPPLHGYDVYEQNRPLVEAVEREGAGWASERMRELGRLAGTPELIEAGALANENPPALRTHDRFGRRIDEVDFHPSWHRLLGLAVEHGIHALPWREPRPGAHVARAAMMFVLSNVESGVGCPVSMTYAAVPALRSTPELAREWEPRLTSLEYDPRLVDPASKRGALCGMAMTEKQGGSDVRANTTAARPIGSGAFALTGHKWFCSAPMSDAFLVLAQTDAGLSCFLLPRVLPGGERNGFHIQRLKNKLGNRSNASSEVEFHEATAFLVGEEGRGVRTIIEMVNHTRLDCVIGSAALLRYGVAHATHHAAHRRAFGKALIDQPLMQNVLADLCVESEAATVTAMRLARAFDRSPEDDREAGFKRIATAVSKYWICKIGPFHTAEALEALGGNGYVEEWPMARAYREAPLNSIWEGSGNVNALDVLRAVVREPASLDAFMAELEEARGRDERYDAYVRDLQSQLSDPAEAEVRARRVVERMASALQGALLLSYGDAAVAEAFTASRLGGDYGRAFGTLPAGLDLKGIIERHRPLV